MFKILLICLFLLSNRIFSQDEEKRFALVIGNSKYKEFPVKNSANDAVLIAKELEKTGFDVLVYNDLDERGMKIRIAEFIEKLQINKGIGMFYFTGYGLQLKGENFLVPVGALIEKEQDIELETINLEWLLSEMEYAQNNMNFIIIDASRENPYTQRIKSSKKNGLAIQAGRIGTFVAFSTTPGKISMDKNNGNSLYALELVSALKIPGLKIEEIFKKVKTQMYLKTKGKQIPWENSGLFADFYFRKIN